MRKKIDYGYFLICIKEEIFYIFLILSVFSLNFIQTETNKFNYANKLSKFCSECLNSLKPKEIEIHLFLEIKINWKVNFN